MAINGGSSLATSPDKISVSPSCGSICVMGSYDSVIESTIDGSAMIGDFWVVFDGCEG